MLLILRIENRNCVAIAHAHYAPLNFVCQRHLAGKHNQYGRQNLTDQIAMFRNG
ncbi:hypothetical protein RHDC3_00426 [Rhodocyclaceae bacterium]|nr:hypothetical protein RHDC3_00426 [Rhodocyclaceae bacterium]